MSVTNLRGKERTEMTKKCEARFGQGRSASSQQHSEWRLCPRPSFYAGSLGRELPSQSDSWTLLCVCQGLGQ